MFKGILGDGNVLELHSAIGEERSPARDWRNELQLALRDCAAPIVGATKVRLVDQKPTVRVGFRTVAVFCARPMSARWATRMGDRVGALNHAAQTLEQPWVTNADVEAAITQFVA